MMRSLDIVVLAKLIVLKRSDWNQVEISKALSISQSEISGSISRSDKALLLNKKDKILYPQNVLDFLCFGMPYVFPVEVESIGFGLASAGNHPKIGSIFSDTSISYVWPHSEGAQMGQIIKPFHPKQAEAALKDKDLYLILACLDILRVGSAREKQVAKKIIQEQVESYEHTVSLLYQ